MATLQDETQDLVHSSIAKLNTVVHAVELSGMFSSNETLDDLSTSYIPYLALDYIIAEMIGKLRITDREERIRHNLDGQKHLHAFIDRIHQYGIISEQDQKSYSTRSNDVKDPSKRRELKIRQFKTEKEVKDRLEAIFRRKPSTPSTDNEFDMIQSILSSPGAPPESDEETLRETCLLVIRIIWMRSQSQLESLNNELELLRAAPPSPPPSVSQPINNTEDDLTWRLDPTISNDTLDGKGPLMDSSGRPLRPFTILPGSASSEKAKFLAQVFRPDHRLPTMTVDEYLEEEKRRGNIISGGGSQSFTAPTKAEKLALDSEMDGTLQSEIKSEEKRQEDERWAQYTESHPKGEGNTMNRG
ncbi:hypothetical protein Clacol_006755 [Clathrus columnatus]|uniref:TAP42-like protein n=1 Tax=Clathrus columnatus TaxID=1419009 RepID=A0AAV5ACZ0_9AGAM|nr:hypothetical protein Clacol_006755 [Clathrus columnatus]